MSGQAWFGETGTDWVFTGTMRFPGDVLAMFDCGTAMPERDELEAIGSEGSLFLDDPWHCNKPVIEVRRGGRVERIELEPVDSYRLELENVSDAIRRRGGAVARTRGRGRAGAGARGAARVGDDRRAREPLRDCPRDTARHHTSRDSQTWPSTTRPRDCP